MDIVTSLNVFEWIVSCFLLCISFVSFGWANRWIGVRHMFPRFVIVGFVYIWMGISVEYIGGVKVFLAEGWVAEAENMEIDLTFRFISSGIVCVVFPYLGDRLYQYIQLKNDSKDDAGKA